MRIKPVSSLVSGLPTQDGNRVPLTRLVPGQGQRGAEAFRAMDPFLLMDHFGPFVMNTAVEIEQAILDYQQGRMGHLD